MMPWRITSKTSLFFTRAIQRGGKKIVDKHGERDGLYRASGFVAEAVSTGKRKGEGEGEIEEATVYWRYAGEEGKVKERREIESLPRYAEEEDAAAHRDDVMALEEKKARQQRQEEEENANRTEKENAETTDEQTVDKKPESDIMGGEAKDNKEGASLTNGQNNGESPKLILPQYESAIIPREKLEAYSLNPNHPKGKEKARAFENALGYNLNNVDALIKNILDNLSQFEAIEKPDLGYGKRFQVDMHLFGPNGKSANVRTAWLLDAITEQMRLISVYIID